jgi:hypothetical protein
MNQLNPSPIRGRQHDLFAAADHNRLVRAGFHPALPVAPVRLLPERPQRRTS